MNKTEAQKNEIERIKLEINRKLAYNKNRKERIQMLLQRKSTTKMSIEKLQRIGRRLTNAEHMVSELQGLLDQIIVQETSK